MPRLIHSYWDQLSDEEKASVDFAIMQCMLIGEGMITRMGGRIYARDASQAIFYFPRGTKLGIPKKFDKYDT
jgi:hypothetical protein